MIKKITKKGLKRNLDRQIALTRKEYPLEVIVGRMGYGGNKGTGDGFLVPVGTGQFFIVPERRITPKSYYRYSLYGKDIHISNGDTVEIFHLQTNRKYVVSL